MINKTNKKREYSIIFFLTIIFYNILILFSKILNPIIIIGVNIYLVIYLLIVLNKKYSVVESLLLSSTLLLPTSFISIMGTSYGELPITVYHILIMLLVFFIIKKITLNHYIFLLIGFIIYALISLFAVPNVIDALKQIITIAFFYITFFIGDHLKKRVNIEAIKDFEKFYMLNIYIFCFIIIIQYIYFIVNNQFIGYAKIYALGRVTFAGYMSDFSFASLYIATGCIIVFINYFYKKINLSKFIISELLFIIVCLIINSRTGLFAFIITAMIFLLLQLFRGNIKAIIIMFLLAITVPIILNVVVDIRGGQAIFDDSGRTVGYIKAINIFFENPLIGVGLGLQNLKNVYGITVPHNLFIQYLTQMGIIGSLIFILFFVSLFISEKRNHSKYKWVIIMIFIGSMAIPDIVSSRYFSSVILLYILDKK